MRSSSEVSWDATTKRLREMRHLLGVAAARDGGLSATPTDAIVTIISEERIIAPTPTYVLPLPSASTYVDRASAELLAQCYRPDLVDCEVQLRIAFCESSWGVGLYNATPVFIGGIEHHAVGWYGMLVPLHARFWDGEPWGGLAADTQQTPTHFLDLSQSRVSPPGRSTGTPTADDSL